MPKLNGRELAWIGAGLAGAGLVLFGLSKVPAGADNGTVLAIDPATATPDQQTVPIGGAQSDYWSYNQPAFQALPYYMPAGTAGGTPGAGDWPGYTGPDYASYLLDSLASLFSGGASTAVDLTNAWLGNTSSATPTNTGNPSPTGGAPATTTPIIQVPPVAPYTPAVLAPPSPPAGGGGGSLTQARGDNTRANLV
jgi:hypothetical protein